MVWISRKLTSEMIAADVPEDQMIAVLSALPTGVYAIENAGGTEIAEAVVREGCITRFSIGDQIAFGTGDCAEHARRTGCAGCPDRVECTA